MSEADPPSENRQSFENALKDVDEGRLSVRKACAKWGLAKSTLHDRVKGRWAKPGKGNPQVITLKEEERLAFWLVERAKRGFGLSVQEFLDSVKTFVEKDGRETPFIENRPRRKWYRGFLKRNPMVRLRNARPLDRKRAKISSEDLDQWFKDYEEFINDNGLVDKPSQIWNCDESGFDLQGKAGKILGPSAPKARPYRVVTGSKEHITVLPCFNAAGQSMPPYFLFQGKRIPTSYNPLEGGVPGSAFSMTEKGYMDAATFYMWFANHFLPHLPPARPVVLLVDSAEAHIDFHTFELAQENGIFIYALLKNATHLVQPADVGLFGPMKQAWYKNVRRFTQTNPNTEICKKNFCSVFKSTWEEVMRPSILCSSFKKSGIYPLRRQEITEDQIGPSLVYTTSLSTPNGPESVSTPLSGENVSLSLSRQSVSSDASLNSVTRESISSPFSGQNASFDARPNPLTRESASLSLADQSASFDARPPLSRENASLILLSLSGQTVSLDPSPEPLARESGSLFLCDENASFDASPDRLPRSSRSLSLSDQNAFSDARPNTQSASVDAGPPLSRTNAPFSVSDKSSSSSLSKQCSSINAVQTPLSRDSGSIATAKSALQAVESVLETPVRVKYRRRIQEGYDLQGSPTFEAWKTLHVAAEPVQNLPVTEHRREVPPEPRLSDRPRTLPRSLIPPASPEVSSFLREITTYPSAPEDTSRRNVNTKRTLPNFMNSESSMNILREQKLKKAREVAERQKKLREREQKREAKKKEQEEKKKKREEQKREKKTAAVTKKRKRPAQEKSKGKQWRTELFRQNQSDDNTCKVCLVSYDPADDENMPWVMCDKCSMWMHIECVPIGVDTTPIDNGGNFFCHDCS